MSKHRSASKIAIKRDFVGRPFPSYEPVTVRSVMRLAANNEMKKCLLNSLDSCDPTMGSAPTLTRLSDQFQGHLHQIWTVTWQTVT